MALLTSAQQLTEIQLLTQDQDPDVANQGLLSSERLSTLNGVYYDWYAQFGKGKTQYDLDLLVANTVTGVFLYNTSLGTFYDISSLEFNPTQIGATGYGTGTVLERCEPGEIEYLQGIRPANGIPSRASWWRDEKNGPFYITVWPTPVTSVAASIKKIGGWVKKYPTALLGGADSPICGEEEARLMARAAAVRCYSLIDSDDQAYLEQLAAPLPAAWKALAFKQERLLKPRPRTTDEAA